MKSPQHSNGGGKAYRAIIAVSKLNFISVERNDGVNTTYIPLISSAHYLPGVNPCAVILTGHGEPALTQSDFQLLSSCDRLYVIAPDYSSYSDDPLYEINIRRIAEHHSNITVVFEDISDDVLDHFREILTDVAVVGW